MWPSSSWRHLACGRGGSALHITYVGLRKQIARSRKLHEQKPAWAVGPNASDTHFVADWSPPQVQSKSWDPLHNSQSSRPLLPDANNKSQWILVAWCYGYVGSLQVRRNLGAKNRRLRWHYWQHIHERADLTLGMLNFAWPKLWNHLPDNLSLSGAF